MASDLLLLSVQVLLQGCGVNYLNIWTVLREIEFSLERFLRGVAEASAFVLETLEKHRVQKNLMLRL